MAVTRLCFADVETTGLEPRRHELWEVALVILDGEASEEHVWQVPCDLTTADPGALRLNRYYERKGKSTQRPAVAQHVARLMAGAVLAGFNPWFDEAFLDRFLRSQGQCPAWNYKLLEVRTYAAGVLGLAWPWDTAAIAEGLGINLGLYEQHTALDDARLAAETWRAARRHAELAFQRAYGQIGHECSGNGSHPGGGKAMENSPTGGALNARPSEVTWGSARAASRESSPDEKSGDDAPAAPGVVGGPHKDAEA